MEKRRKFWLAQFLAKEVFILKEMLAAHPLNIPPCLSPAADGFPHSVALGTLKMWSWQHLHLMAKGLAWEGEDSCLRM